MSERRQRTAAEWAKALDDEMMDFILTADEDTLDELIRDEGRDPQAVVERVSAVGARVLEALR